MAVYWSESGKADKMVFVLGLRQDRRSLRLRHPVSTTFHHQYFAYLVL
jgi:hypothetical protein